MSNPQHISTSLHLPPDLPRATARRGALAERAAEVGLHRDTLVEYLRCAQWKPERFHVEVKQPGWWERLRRDAFEAEIDSRVAQVGPPGFRALTDEQISPKLTPRLRKWVEAYDGRSAVVLGPTGIGKSLAAYLVLRRVKRAAARKALNEQSWRPGPVDNRPASERWHDGWISAQGLVVSQRCHPLGEDEAPEVWRAKTRRVVVIDDITWPPRDDLTREVLGARYDAGLPVIVTAGMPKAELFARFGDALSRRCLDARGERGVIVDCFRD